MYLCITSQKASSQNIMNASENLKYIESLKKCPALYKTDSDRIKILRNKLSENTTMPEEQRECWLDLLDSGTILTDMLFPMQNVIGLMTHYRGVELYNFNQIFECEPIGSLDLYNFLKSITDSERKTIINKLTPSDELRGRLILAVKSSNPKGFLSLVAKSNLDKNILMGIYGLDYGRRFSQDPQIGSNTYIRFETAISYLISRHENMLFDLANYSNAEGNSTMVEILERILATLNVEFPFGENIEDILSIKNSIRPSSFRKICRNLTYLYVLGLYVAFDRNRFDTPEITIIRQILLQNQFRNYGTIVFRKCLMKLSDIELYNIENRRYNSLKNNKPELAKIIERSFPFIEDSLVTDNTGRVAEETYGCGINIDTTKLQILINALGYRGYIDDNIETKRLLYYRLTGFARPEKIGRIDWHKDKNMLFLLIKTVMEKQKGKYDRIPAFFNTIGTIPQGKESSYAERVNDKIMKDLIAYLYQA